MSWMNVATWTPHHLASRHNEEAPSLNVRTWSDSNPVSICRLNAPALTTTCTTEVEPVEQEMKHIILVFFYHCTHASIDKLKKRSSFASF